jgi:hypothetical protein
MKRLPALFLLVAACGGGGGGGLPGVRVVSVVPAPNASIGEPPASITVRFDNPVNPQSFNEDTFLVTMSGGDGVIGNLGDVTLFPTTFVFPDARTAVLDFTGIPLPDEIFRLRLVATGDRRILAQDGIAMDGEFTGTFPSGDGTEGGDFTMFFRATTSVESMAPAPGSVGPAPAAVVVRLSPDVDPATVGAASFRVVRSGGDGNFANGNEVGLVAASVTEVSPGQFRFDLGGNAVPADTYEVRVAGAGAGEGLHFDGMADLVRVPPNADFRPGTASFTVECWVEVENAARADGLVECADSDFGNGWRLGHAAGGSFLFAVSGASATRTATGGPPPASGGWHHVAGVFDAALGETRLYVDGALAATDSGGGAGAVTPAAPLFLGRNGGMFLLGSLDEVRFWALARTESEIRRDMYRRLAGTEPSLRACWRFDDDVLQFVVDAAPAQHTGTLGVDTATGDDDPARRPSPAWPVVRDLDGDPLDGTFAGTLPAGVGSPGADFAATFRVP